MVLRKLSPFVAVFALSVAGCGDEGAGPDPGPDPEDPAFPADFATSYTLVADQRGSSSHPACIEVYCSPDAAAAYSSRTYPLPEGCVIVKVVYEVGQPPLVPCANPTGYVVMQKLAPGTEPGSGDWHWQDVDANRSVISSGQIQSCIGCHDDCASTDDWTCVDPNTRL